MSLIDDYFSSKFCSLTNPTFSLQIHLITNNIIPQTHELRPSKIDFYKQSSDGVYYPDNLTFFMGWKGGGFEKDKKEVKREDKIIEAFFNPFLEGFQIKDLIGEEFTPIIINNKDSDDDSKATSNAKTLTKFLLLQSNTAIATSETRGNLAICSQHKKPNWLNTAQYLLCGTLRAFPNQQYRKLCIALQDNNLPIDRDEVHVLLKTVLYHVGDLYLN
jgi:hypothetical protein